MSKGKKSHLKTINNVLKPLIDIKKAGEQFAVNYDYNVLYDLASLQTSRRANKKLETMATLIGVDSPPCLFTLYLFTVKVSVSAGALCRLQAEWNELAQKTKGELMLTTADRSSAVWLSLISDI